MKEFASWLRNQEDYDDFEYGTEVIPGDRTWTTKKDNVNCGSCSCKINDSKE
jgi:hypothetical protein